MEETDFDYFPLSSGEKEWKTLEKKEIYVEKNVDIGGLVGITTGIDRINCEKTQSSQGLRTF